MNIRNPFTLLIAGSFPTLAQLMHASRVQKSSTSRTRNWSLLGLLAYFSSASSLAGEPHERFLKKEAQPEKGPERTVVDRPEASV